MKTILSDIQKQFLDEFKKDEYLTKTFYLTGGTALAAYYLHHRASEDLDFFCQENFNISNVDQFINKFKEDVQALKVERNRIFDRFIYTFVLKKNLLKVEFVVFEHKNLKPLDNKGGLLINDEYDIAVNKLFTIQDRTEIKDFVDLYFLLKKYSFDDLISGVKNKFGFTTNTIALGGMLMKVEKLDLMPRMIIPLNHADLVTFFRKLAYDLKKDIFE